MSETQEHNTDLQVETASEPSTEPTPETDPITEIFSGECPSVSGRSILTYAIGRHNKSGELHLRIVDNSGKGMWFNGWAAAKDIDSIVKGATELTAKSFHALHPGKSINTGGFVMAVLRDLGLIRANEENTRLHEHVPATTLEKVVMVRMGKTIEPAPVTKPAKRKGKAV